MTGAGRMKTGGKMQKKKKSFLWIIFLPDFLQYLKFLYL